VRPPLTSIADLARRSGTVRRTARMLSGEFRETQAVRRWIARRHLSGEGVEIGALHLPLPVPRAARVRYVDRADREGLRRAYPELNGFPLVDVDVVDDGERLDRVPDASMDFVVANHFLEHTEDPIGTLASHRRVLRPGGCLMYAIPDKRHTFDTPRAVTPLDHLIDDHVEGPERSRSAHYREWAELVKRVPPEQVDSHARRLERSHVSIHFHVWTPASFADFVLNVRRAADLDLELVALHAVQREFIIVLRRP
jgi:SAM-dependent methyltransferase